MFLSKSLRRLVAGTAAVLFLACQGMAIARASTPAFPQSGAGTAQASCHGAGNNTDDNVYQAQCQSQNASSTLSKAVYSTTDLPAITVRFEHPLIAVHSVPLAVSPPARIESPPLSILHCCLRN